MKIWLRFQYRDRKGFGTADREWITEYAGDMFRNPEATDRRIALAEVELLPPTVPSKIVALWNNFHALSAKLGVPEPSEPLYLLKAPSSVTAPDAVVSRPPSYDGRIVWEGELGIVIGKTCRGISPDEADAFIFGYTCVNDLTAADLIGKDATFAQWARAKSFDGFCPFGPVIATDIEPASLIVRTIVNGAERQSYPISDMIFSAQEIVSRLSHDMTLFPGDLICCGTSLGVGSIKEASSSLVIAIDGIGELKTEFRLYFL
ncbi:fumarylacetoacetate hydrolase family protein [Bradyrhizobium canariense]|uniref:2-keto-4-pentenoate hydratase/2-oxohepta-3-ene-1,7-dioic acid hydratase (Catechol pathway) n=1 Tax=Bradyrhizobium canariense TaxID=255045 RepID=A0A1H1N7L9_9BRAD|nr:fumarylacetoacetate hydrolase family protein [Bradyrhizobium canariense]SDR94179.1 2-keto-4-pentenoate hydratase/2-oxohepta-3-ene-1,7-dioic acid hydratase (catechol pathway) [Bradyrhizobium canariense]